MERPNEDGVSLAERTSDFVGHCRLNIDIELVQERSDRRGHGEQSSHAGQRGEGSAQENGDFFSEREKVGFVCRAWRTVREADPRIKVEPVMARSYVTNDSSERKAQLYTGIPNTDGVFVLKASGTKTIERTSDFICFPGEFNIRSSTPTPGKDLRQF